MSSFLKKKDTIILVTGLLLFLLGIGLLILGPRIVSESYNIIPKEANLTALPSSSPHLLTWLPQGTRVVCDVHISGGNNDLDFSLVSPLGTTLIEERITSPEQITWVANENGYYRLIFDNGFSNVTTKYLWYGVVSADFSYPFSYFLRDMNDRGVSLVFVVLGLVLLFLGGRSRLSSFRNGSKNSSSNVGVVNNANISSIDKLNFQFIFIGLSFILFGTLLAEYSWLKGYSITLPALGIVAVIIGSTICLSPVNPIPKADVRFMVHESYANNEAILTQFSPKGKCIYLPPRNGQFFAFIPMEADQSSTITSNANEIPARIVTQLNSIRLVTIFLPLSFETFSKIPVNSSLENSLEYILKEHFGLIKSLKIIYSNNQIIINLNGVKVINEYPICKQIIGSLPTSLTGCVLSFSLKKPVILIEESLSMNHIHAVFEESK